MPETYDSKLLSRHTLASNTVEFVLERPAGLDYRAGQYLDIVLPHAEDATPKEAWIHGFSFASAPFEEHVAAATRMRDSAFKNAIRDTPDGTVVQLIAPWGDFILHKNEKVSAVFLIGGIGITPVLSMLAQASHERSGHKLTLLYANRSPEDAAYTDRLMQLAADNPDFTFVPVYTQAKVEGAEHGHVDADMIRRHVPDLAAPRWYLSGPRGMVTAMRALLVDVGADEDNIRTEEFDGY